MNARQGVKAIAILLVLAIALFVGLTTASYSSVVSGSGIARVAAFGVSVWSDDSPNLVLDMSSGSDNAIVYAFNVSNESNGSVSDVAIQLRIHVSLPTALPDGIIMTLNGNAGTVSSDGREYVFSSDSWRFVPGVYEMQAFRLEFAGDADTIASSVSISDIDISVVAEQVD